MLASVKALSKVPSAADVDECGNCADCKANFSKTGMLAYAGVCWRMLTYAGVC
jgi:hypothetical protein